MRQTNAKERIPIRVDYILILSVVAMISLGFISIYSATNLIKASDPAFFLKQQSMWLMIGLVAVAVILYVGNDSIFEVTKILYWILLGLLVYLLLARILNAFTGKVSPLPFTRLTNGAFSWLFLGPGSLQPSEFMKIVLLLLCAQIVADHNEVKVSNSFSSDIELLRRIGVWVLPPVVLTLLQPDTGLVLIIGVSILFLLFASGIRREWYLIFFGIIAVFLIVFFYLYFFQQQVLSYHIGAYRVQRFNSWFYPELYKSGDGLQQYNSKLIIGSAGLTGHGLQQYLIDLPEAQTDMIFSVLGQSFGFIGTSITVLLCAIFDGQIARVAMRSSSQRDRYFLCGVIGMILFQQIENIGMVIGLLPITGITLPFISYGGSSLLSYMIVFGIVLNTSLKEKRTRAYN